jgi:peroxiredoxin Q/BCP
VKVLDVGDPAPDDRLLYDDGSPGSLADHRGTKLVVFFYPKAMTPGCTTEACGFRDDYERFRAAGYEIVGISPDPPADNAAFRARDDLPFRLLSDQDHVVAARLGAWGIKRNYGKEYEGLIRSTFVVDEDGALTHAWRNVKATGHVERVARELLGG